MSKTIDQAVYDRIFNCASALLDAAAHNSADTLSAPMARILFALANAWEKEPENSDQFSAVVAEAEKLAVAYEAFRMEVLAQ